MSYKKEIVDGMTVLSSTDGLIPCPKCGNEGEYQEYSYGGDDKLFPGRHEGRVICSNDSCTYHTRYWKFPDSPNRNEYYTVPCSSDDDCRTYIKLDWNRLCLAYRKNLDYRTGLDKRRCDCGRAIREGWNFCPRCGAKVIA